MGAGALKRTVKRQIDIQIEHKKDFKVREIGSSIELICKNGKERGRDWGLKMKGSHLSGMTVSHVRKRIKEETYIPINQDNERDHIDSVCYSPENIKRLLGLPCLEIDINSCYWNTAYNIGLIDKSVYDYGMREKDWKKSRNMAIGALGTFIIEKNYEKGLLKDTQSFHRDLNVARLDVIDHVWHVAQDIISNIPDDFCMFLTDAFYVFIGAKEKVLDLLDKYNYTASINRAMFDEILYDNVREGHFIKFWKSIDGGGDLKDTYIELSRYNLLNKNGKKR